MIYPHGKLTDEQIKTTYIGVPALGIAMALGKSFAADHVHRREAIRAKGGELYLFAWPDGTFAELHRLDALKPFEHDVLVELYRAAARAEVQMLAGENNHGA